MMEAPTALLVTPGELSQLLKVSLKTIYYWVERNEIPFTKIGRHLRFEPNEVIQFFREKTRKSRPYSFRGVLASPSSRSLTTSATVNARDLASRKEK